MLRISDVFPFRLVPPGSPLAIASFSGQRSGTGSGVSHSSRKGWPRRRLSSVPSAAGGMLMGLSQCFDLAPDGPKFSTPVGPSRPRSNRAPWLEPTSRPGAPLVAWSVPHCRAMTGVSPASAIPPRELELARPRSACRIHSKPVRHGQAFPDASGPPSMSTTLILVVCDRLRNSSCASAFLTVQTSRTTLFYFSRKRYPP